MNESGRTEWEYNCHLPTLVIVFRSLAVIRFIRGAIITAIAYFIVCQCQYCWIVADVIGTCKVEEEQEGSLNVASHVLVLRGMCAFEVLSLS